MILKVHWDDRLRGKGIQKGVFENVFVAIDTTECPVASGFKAIYSGYKKKHTLKYEAAVSLYSREFVWAPVPSVRGPEADQTAFNFYKIYEHMLEDELFIGDGHYAGLCKSMVGTLDEFRIVKDYYSKVRAIVEHAFNRLKNFNCMAQPWRHDVTAHWRAYKICLHVTNIIFRIKPLHKEPHPFLFIDVL